MIEVMIVDDQRTVREIYKDYIEADPNLKLVGCADNGREAIELVEAHRPNVVLMDIEMPILDGLTATKIITDKYINTNILIVSVHNEDNYLNSALQVGAKGYLKKNTPEKELINAIYSAYKGYFQLGPGLLEQYLRKTVESQSNFQEIEQLKTVILQQSKLLDNLHRHDGMNNNGNGNGNRNGNRRQARGKQISIEEKYHTLEEQYSYVFTRLNELDRRFRFHQQRSRLVLFILLFIVLLGTVFVLFNLLN